MAPSRRASPLARTVRSSGRGISKGRRTLRRAAWRGCWLCCRSAAREPDQITGSSPARTGCASTRGEPMTPEAMPAEGTKSDLRLMVEQFYDALVARDPEAVASVIDEHFAPDVRLLRPE